MNKRMMLVAVLAGGLISSTAFAGCPTQGGQSGQSGQSGQQSGQTGQHNGGCGHHNGFFKNMKDSFKKGFKAGKKAATKACDKVQNKVMDTGVAVKKAVTGKKPKTFVTGHYKKDGTHVQGHFAKVPGKKK